MMLTRAIRALLIVPLVMATGLLSGECFAAKTKMIQWGGAPPLTYIRDHIRDMEKTPFDGLILTLTSSANGQSISWDVWKPVYLKAEDYARDVQVLKETKFKRFTDNLLVIDVAPGRIDWFSDDFKYVPANAGLVAKLARQAGMKGIMFDVEQYDGQLFDYAKQTGKDTHTFREYEAKVRERGREFMKAINAEYQDIVILTTFSYEVGSVGDPALPREKQVYGLYPPFVDGMLDAASPKTRIYDGFEYAYGLKTEKEFKGARDFMLIHGAQVTGNLPSYKKHYGASFGIWTDNGRHWDPVNHTSNYFTPEEFGYALHNALKYSDRYVWVYSEASRWWNWDGHGNVPQPYLDALANARKPHETAPAARVVPPQTQ